MGVQRNRVQLTKQAPTGCPTDGVSVAPVGLGVPGGIRGAAWASLLSGMRLTLGSRKAKAALDPGRGYQVAREKCRWHGSESAISGLHGPFPTAVSPAATSGQASSGRNRGPPAPAPRRTRAAGRAGDPPVSRRRPTHRGLTRTTPNFENITDYAVRLVSAEAKHAAALAAAEEARDAAVMGWTPPDGILVPRWWCRPTT